MPISVETVRIGKRYVLKNYGEHHEFDVLAAVDSNDFICKDLTSLEKFKLSELTAYGQGNDYDFYSIND